MKRRVVHFLFSPYVGGAEAVALQLLRRLDRGRHEHLVVVNRELEREFAATGLPVRALGSFGGFSRLLRPYPPFPFLMRKALELKAWELSRLLKQLRADVLHTHLAFDHFISSRITRPMTRVMNIHGSYRLDMVEPFLFTRGEIRGIFDSGDHIASACGFFLRLLEGAGVDLAGRGAIIPNGIDLAAISRVGAVPAPDGLLKMVFLGGDRWEKGGDILMRALGLVANRSGRRDFRLDVLRKTDPSSDVARLAAEEKLLPMVRFQGYVPGEGHLRFIGESDLFVLPSRTEGVANTLLEAVGLGKPVLATRVGGTEEVVTHGTHGFLCEPAPEGLAEGVLFFLEHRDKLREFGERNLARRGDFAWEKALALYEGLYD